MVFGGTVSSPRGTLSVTQSLALANIYLENATQAQDPDIALVLCHDTATSLTQVRKVCRRSEDEAIRKEVAIAYISLGQVLASYGHQMEAQASYNKAKKWGEKVQDHLQLFTENVRLTAVVDRLPAPDERLANTLQLACCLALLKDSHSYDDILGPAARNWLQTVKNNEDEQERLKILATSVIKEFKKEIKDAKSVSEVVCLAPILEKDDFQDLLLEFYNGVNGSLLPDFYQLDGLARMIQAAGPGYLHVHDLVKILGALAARLQNTQKHAPQHMFQLVLAASHVLDAMADTHIEGLDHETLHQPLMSYLDSFKGSSDPFMMYQVAYAYQALLYVPGNEKLWQATLRRTSKVTQGVLGLVSAERGLNLNGFLDGLKDIQQGTSSTAGMTKTVAAIFDGTSDLTSGGHGFLEGLKEGSSFQSKCAWYPALRGADAFIRDGDFIAFKQLVYEVPCRLDLPFQWGVCQRLGEIAINQSWDVSTQQSAATLLGEIYRNTEDWGDHSSIQDAIIAILTRLESSTGSISQFTESLLRELESRTDPDERNLLLERRKKDPNTCPLKPALPPLGSPSLVDRVQNKPDVEGSLRRLRNQRLKERSDAVYIPPQAKENLPFSYGVRFSLTEKVKEFIGSEQKVFLVLGDSGAGKSTFIRRLECDLWQDYKNTRRIPLHINLPAIDKPEQDLIAKQLRKLEFTDPEILELKTRRRFILICDGYDESQQTHNLYMSNRLNQKGEWKAQMIVSCHSDYIGDDYQDQFQPEDDNRPDPGQYQEAVITPFSEDQVHDYIKQFVSLHQPLWEVKDYTRALDLIPCLKDVVKNPFLLVLSLEVLPRMMDPGEHISDTRVTRVALYDHFIEHWLERGEIRLREKKMTPQAKSTFEELVEDGFTRNAVDFLKRLAVSIYKEQSGQPIVLYSRAQDEGTWKAEFFGREDEKQILREVSPLLRSRNQYRFLHRSLLEYALALSIFDPQVWKGRSAPTPNLCRRGSTDSAFSFQSYDDYEVAPAVNQDHDINSPLAWRNLLKDPSVLQFLTERVQQEPVFKKQLLTYIELSKMDRKWRKAASNSITILVRAGVMFHGADLQGIRIPGADLSYGLFDSANLQDSDLRQVNLRGAWLRQADLSDTMMAGAHFGELPYLLENSEVKSCAYSPDGRSLAVGLEDGDIHLYSTSTWEIIQTMSGHPSGVLDVMYSPDSDHLASGSCDCTVRLWDLHAGVCTHILDDHTGSVYSMAYSPEGATLATASHDKTVRVWDVDTGDCRLKMTGHTSPIYSVVYSPDGNWIVSGSGDGTVRLQDAETGECLHVIETQDQHMWTRDVSYSPQGGLIAFGSGNTLRLWNTGTREIYRELIGHNGAINSVAFSPRGDMIASAGDDKVVRIWDVESGSCRQILKKHASPIQCVVFSPCGKYIISGSADRTVKIWTVEGTIQHSDRSASRTSSVKYSPQRDQIAVASCDKTIRLWDVKTGSCLHTLSGHRGIVASMDYSPCGGLLASGGEDCTVRLWDVRTGGCRQVLIGQTSLVGHVAFSPLGSQVASVGVHHAVKLWNLETGESTHTFPIGRGLVQNIVYSPNGNRIAAVLCMRNVQIWDTETGVCLHTLGDSTTDIMDVVYSPRGDTIATASQNGEVRVWNTENQEYPMILAGHRAMVKVIVYSPQGNQLVSGCTDGIINLWDADNGNCIRTLNAHSGSISCIKYSADGLQIVSTDGLDVRLWDMTSGRCLGIIQGVSGKIMDMALDSTTGINRLVTIMHDGSSRCWQVTETDGRYDIRLMQGPTNGELVVAGSSIEGVRGLSQNNRQLLAQRGACGSPFDRFREAGRRLISMASVMSANQNAAG